MQLVLSLFPGIGLLDMAFEELGYCVVRGPDALWGGDVKRFHPPAGVFQGVIGGPPCKAFTRLRHIIEANGYALAENLIPEFERVVDESRPDWYLMENVPDAPWPRIDGYVNHQCTVKDVWCGGHTSRERMFSFASRPLRLLQIETLALHAPDPARAVTCDGREVPVAIGGSGKRKPGVSGGRLPQSGPKMSVSRACELQGLPKDFLNKAPFTEAGKRLVIGNGVPLAMGRAIAAAVKRATEKIETAA